MQKVTVITANKLSKTNLDALKKTLTKKYGKDLEYEFKLDESVIGGIKLVIGSQAIDMTVKAKLAEVKKQVLAKI
jgi:F-type H+-transporting ATPase subunit delta